MKTLVIVTGGTFSSTRSSNGLKVAEELQTELLIEEAKKFFKNSISLSFEQTICKLSENIDPNDWALLANTIKEKIDQYDSVLVIHGTDTMAYTSSAISYIENITKKLPVVFTGANYPLEFSDKTDAVVNFIQSLGALKYFVNNHITGSFIVFNGSNNYEKLGLIHIGSKVKKDKWEETCYRSCYIGGNHFGEIDANMEVSFDIDAYNKMVPQDIVVDNLKISFNADKVMLLKIYPGMDAKIINYLVDNGVKAIVLEIYSSGTAPVQDTTFSFKESLKYAQEKDVLIFAISQHEGKQGAVMNIYETSNILNQLGVIPLGNLVWEATVPKLMLAIENFNRIDEISRYMKTSISGEIQI